MENWLELRVFVTVHYLSLLQSSHPLTFVINKKISQIFIFCSFFDVFDMSRDPSFDSLGHDAQVAERVSAAGDDFVDSRESQQVVSASLT